MWGQGKTESGAALCAEVWINFVCTGLPIWFSTGNRKGPEFYSIPNEDFWAGLEFPEQSIRALNPNRSRRREEADGMPIARFRLSINPPLTPPRRGTDRFVALLSGFNPTEGYVEVISIAELTERKESQ